MLRPQVFARRVLRPQVFARRVLRPTHPVLEKHRSELDRWSKKADDALVATRGTSLVRGQAHQTREEMAENLTRERDGLYIALVGRAQERRLSREWPSLFFRTKSHHSKAIEEESETTPPTP